MYGAFPLAYAVIIDALSIPLTAMLLGLIFRGVAFEFRFKAIPEHRPIWDKAFIVGSVLATFSQGVAVGTLLNGLSVSGRAFSGSALVWLARSLCSADWDWYWPMPCWVALADYENRRLASPQDVRACNSVNHWFTGSYCNYQCLDPIDSS